VRRIGQAAGDTPPQIDLSAPQIALIVWGLGFLKLELERDEGASLVCRELFELEELLNEYHRVLVDAAGPPASPDASSDSPF
jgi:hypothetical protein